MTAAKKGAGRIRRPARGRADPEEVEGLIRYAERAYEEAYQAACESGDVTVRPFKVAVEAWRNAFPTLVARTEIRAYIALVATGMAKRRLDAEEARGMMYTAQTAISLMGKEGKI
jgi:hypothetical protein